MNEVNGLTAQELALLQPARNESASADGHADAPHGAACPIRSVCNVSLKCSSRSTKMLAIGLLTRCLGRCSDLVEVRLLQVESLSYSQFVASRDDPTAFVVLEASPQRRRW